MKKFSLFLLLSFYLLSFGFAQGKSILVVGVFSPESKASSSIGSAHHYWNQAGLEYAGNNLTEFGDYQVQIEFIDTKSEDSDCREKYDAFLQRFKNAILILGPVRSGCIKNIHTKDVALPIISSLASATELTEVDNIKSPWFFRANITDKTRLNKLISFIESKPEYKNNAPFLIYDNLSAYGKGLKNDFIDLNNIDDENVINIEAALLAEGSLLEKIIDNNKISNVFILGASTRAMKVANKLSDIGKSYLNKSFFLFTVGSSPNMLQSSPYGLITIGEASFKEHQSSKYRIERARISEQVIKSGNSFYPTTYASARFIAPEVIKAGLKQIKSSNKPFSIKRLRSYMKEILASGYEFNSLNPPDILKFDISGNLDAEFEFPIYELEPAFKKINIDNAELPWIEILAQSKFVSFLESPVSITLFGHNTDKYNIDISLKEVDGATLYTESNITLNNGETKQVSFHVKQPGKYEFTSNRKIFPADTEVHVELTLFYFVCFISAFIGAFCKLKTFQNDDGFHYGDYIQGAIIGLILAFASTYVKYSLVPVVETDWNLLNGAMYGFIGGFFGPWIVHIVASKFGVHSNK